MMRPRKVLHVACAALIATMAACGRPPSPPPAPPWAVDGGAATYDGGADYGDWPAAACAALRSAGCEEGMPPCEEVIRDAERLHLVDLHARCVGRAESRAAMLACGPEITCTPVAGAGDGGGD